MRFVGKEVFLYININDVYDFFFFGVDGDIR